MRCSVTTGWSARRSQRAWLWSLGSTLSPPFVRLCLGFWQFTCQNCGEQRGHEQRILAVLKHHFILCLLSCRPSREKGANRKKLNAHNHKHQIVHMELRTMSSQRLSHKTSFRSTRYTNKRFLLSADPPCSSRVPSVIPANILPRYGVQSAKKRQSKRLVIGSHKEWKSLIDCKTTCAWQFVNNLRMKDRILDRLLCHILQPNIIFLFLRYFFVSEIVFWLLLKRLIFFRSINFAIYYYRSLNIK